MKKNKVVIFDLNLLFCRCYTAVSMFNDQGVEIGGYYQTIRSLLSNVTKIEPDHVLCVWDGIGGSKKRKQDMLTYKQGRLVPNKIYKTGIDDIDNDPQARAKSMKWQMSQVYKIIENMPFQQLAVDDYEADDVIAYLANKFSILGSKVVIVSNDKDFLQLVSPNIYVYRQTPNDKKIYNIKTMKEMYDGLHGNSYLFYRMFQGDPSDNIRGIKGYGHKRYVKSVLPILKAAKYDISSAINIIKSLSDIEQNDKIIRENKDCIKHIKTASSIVNKFDSGLNGIDILNRNYKIMQLQNTIIDSTTSSKITDSIENFHPKFLPMNIMGSLLSDGITSLNMSEDKFFATCNQIKFKSEKFLDSVFS
jgi:5'-3' exonuclease